MEPNMGTPPPPHGYPPYQWPAFSGYPLESLPVEIGIVVDSSPAAQHKLGGNGEISGGQGER